MNILILASFALAAQAQFPVFTDVPGVPAKPWEGPIADHQLGHHPPDTPEVAAAKAKHLEAYREIVAVLPELPPEERYRKHGLPLPAVVALQKQAHDQLRDAQAHHVQPTHTPFIQPTFPVIPHIQATGPTILAEDIPRSPTGEVPEVYAARLAHLKALEDARVASLGH